MFSKEAQALAKATVEAIKKISKDKWKWEPQRYDHFVLPTKLMQDGIVWSFNKSNQKLTYLGSASDEAEINECICAVEYRYAVPFFHWERIEEILLRCPADGGCWNFYEPFKFIPDIYRGKFQRWKVEYMWRYERTGVCPTKHWDWGKTRQLAVMRAVIELGKET